MMKVKISELYDVGSSKRVFQSEWKDSGIPFYRAREIAKLAIDGYVDNELFIDEELYETYVARYGKPQSGDVMITGVGTLGVCYVVQESDRFYFKDGNILWFRQKAPDRILPEFLVKAFASQEIKDYISKNSSGTTVGTFTIQTANKMEITLPSIEEQRVIISKISLVEEIIKNRKKELQKLDELVKARFVELFGSVENNEFGYEIMNIQDVCEPIKDGTHQTPTYTNDAEKGYKFLSSKDVTSGKIDWAHLKYIPEELHNELYKRLSPRKGDILLAKNGTTGVAAIVDRDEVFDIYVSLALLRPLGTVTSEYLCAAVNSAETKRQFDNSLKGIGVPNLHLGEIKKTKIIVPPMERQNHFATFVKQVDKSKVVCVMALQAILE